MSKAPDSKNGNSWYINCKYTKGFWTVISLADLARVKSLRKPSCYVPVENEGL